MAALDEKQPSPKDSGAQRPNYTKPASSRGPTVTNEKSQKKDDVKQILTKINVYECRTRVAKVTVFVVTISIVFVGLCWLGSVRIVCPVYPAADEPQTQLQTLIGSLTRVYGTHFQQSTRSIEEALRDSHLRDEVFTLLKWQCASLCVVPAPTNDVEKPTEAVANHTVSSLTEAITIHGASHVISDIHNQPTAAALRFATEKTLFVELPVSGAKKSNGAQLMKRFQELAGHKVRYYVGKKSPILDVAGNANVWTYFVPHWSDRDLLRSRRGDSLTDANPKTAATESDNPFLFSGPRAARTSVDNRFLLYDGQICGPDFGLLSRTNRVTVATQTSMDRLVTFVDSYKYWTGPISLAVFLKGPLEYVLLRSYISFLKLCHPNHHRQTCFSIATPVENPMPRNVLIESKTFGKFDCRSKSDDIFVEFKKQLNETNAWLKVEYYPQNMMRNLARANIRTDYQLTLDVDIAPCARMSDGLNKFLDQHSVTSNALVVPTYEISRKIDFPQTKRELVSLTGRRLAQPFHRDVYLPNQNATNFPKWEKIHDSFEDVHVVHEVQHFPLHYEPFFVELNTNPLYDEGFVGYGFTRSSHAFEVFVRNGKFFILSPIFTAQLGIKKMKEWSDFRQQQNEHNRQRFDEFVKNITSQHPNMKRVQKNSDISYYHSHEFNRTTST